MHRPDFAKRRRLQERRLRMTDKAAKLNEIIGVISTLDEMQLDEFLYVAKSFSDSKKDFDYIAPDDSKRITEAFEGIKSGKGVSFGSAEEMVGYFGLQDVVNGLEDAE